MPAESSPVTRPPALPKHPTGGTWHKLTRRWWKDVWQSPQHHEFLRADLGALFRLAILQNEFFITGKLAFAQECRHLEREFGLTPLSRRRLEWTVTQTEDAIDRHEKRRSKAAKVINGDDPRDYLSK